MASVNLLLHESNTTNGTSFTTSGTATPTANAVVLLFIRATNATSATVSDSQAHTWTQLRENAATSTTAVYWTKENASPVAFTITIDCGVDSADGFHVAIVEVPNGDSADPIRQSSPFDSGLAAEAPNITFATSPLAANICIGMVCNLTNPAGITPPTNWTELVDSGHAIPAQGIELAWDIGETSTIITWGASASAWNAVAVEVRLPTIIAEPSSFTLTGNATGLKIARKLIGSVEAFTLTGISTNLQVARKLLTSVGSFTLTGLNTGFKIDRKLLTALGEFTLTGSTVNLIYSSAVATIKSTSMLAAQHIRRVIRRGR